MIVELLSEVEEFLIAEHRERENLAYALAIF